MKKLIIFTVFLMLMVFVAGCTPNGATMTPEVPETPSELTIEEDSVLEFDEEFEEFEELENEDFEDFEDLGDSFTI